MGSTDFLIVVAIPLAAGVLALLFGVALPRFRRSRQRKQGITLATFANPGLAVPPRPTRKATPDSPVAAQLAPPPPADPVREAVTPVSPWAPPAPPPRPEAPVTPQAHLAPPAREATGTMGPEWGQRPPAPDPHPRLRLEPQGERLPTPPEPRPALRVSRPLDGTLQFLPGRLEIIEGRDMGQEIRFVRQPGQSVTEVTFGRQDGVPYRHVQLHEPTVSRLHAKVTLEGKDWRLTNLSRTNPVTLNGASMAPENTSILLKEGDRIEMGEVVFRFRAK